MLTTKLYYGFVFILMGYLPSENVAIENRLNAIKNGNIPTKTDAPNSIAKNIQQPGKEIYTDFCIQCHGGNGKGNGVNIPPLAGSDWLVKKRKQSINAVKFGQNGEIVVNKKKFNNSMPAMGLSNQEVADVMNYIMTSWGNKQSKKVTEKEVEGVLK